MNNKVYVTGLGIISAIGNNIEETLRSFENHNSGVGSIAHLRTRYDKEFPLAEVKLGNEELASKANLPSSISRTILLSYLATKEALSTFSLEEIKKYRLGFISANTVGGMDKTENFYEEFFTDNSKGNLHDVINHDCGKATDYVAQQFGIKGFVTTLSTACSSSANSIMLGARLIKSNRADIVIAGGVDSLTRFTLNGFNTLMIVDNKQCRPLDQSRTGLNLGEGAAYLLLMSEKAAKELKSEIYCELKGYCNTNDSHHQTALSDEGNGPFLAMQGALKMSNLTPADIDYINMHGTGTQNNDAAEGKAVERIFDPEYPRLSSTKSFTGHTLGASGSIEAVFSALAIKKGIVFPNYNFNETINGLNFQPETKFQKNVNLINILSNSFGFGGNCTSLVFSKS